jgi:tetratricopeptide (TPR) repeat protein
MSQDPSSPHDKTPFEKNPFDVLGLQGTEDLAAIRKAFLRIAAQSHPDRLRTKPPEEKALALELFLSAKKAFEVLSQPDRRREWSERMARAKPRTPTAPVTPPPEAPAPSAPAAPRPGPALTPAHGVPVASPPPAASTAPRTPSGVQPAAAALQLYKLGMLALESFDYAKALDLFSKAAKVSPTPRNQAMELVCRGHQYLSTRFFDRARESFERALQLLPECREARMGLELLDKQSGRYLKGR